jgi:hypothetical protein
VYSIYILENMPSPGDTVSVDVIWGLLVGGDVKKEKRKGGQSGRKLRMRKDKGKTEVKRVICICSETTLTGESQFHISTPQGI